MDLTLCGNTSLSPDYKGTIIVPPSIKQVLLRNKLDYIDILNYSKLRNLLSIEDMAKFISLNTNKGNVFPEYFLNSFSLKNTWAGTMSIEAEAEYNNVIFPLANSLHIADSNIDSLREIADVRGVVPTTMTPVESGAYLEPTLLNNIPINPPLSFENIHNIKFIQNMIFIFVERGLINVLKDRSYLRKLVSDYLKVLYSVLPIHIVSRQYSRVFENYLKLL